MVKTKIIKVSELKDNFDNTNFSPNFHLEIKPKVKKFIEKNSRISIVGYNGHLKTERFLSKLSYNDIYWLYSIILKLEKYEKILKIVKGG